MLWRSKVSYRLPDAVLISNSTESSDISRNFRKLHRYKCLAFLSCLFSREHHRRSTHETDDVSINLNIAQSAFCIENFDSNRREIVASSLSSFLISKPAQPPTPPPRELACRLFKNQLRIIEKSLQLVMRLVDVSKVSSNFTL